MVLDTGFWVVQTLNALQLSMLLFLLSIGLTVIFGLMHFVNLAHGSLYALGAFSGYAAVKATGSYWAGFVFGAFATMLVGALLYAGLVRHMRTSGPMNQVLVTFGLIFVFYDLFRILFGDFALGLQAPALLSGRIELAGIVYPAYRLFIIGAGLAVMVALSVLLKRTRIGAMVRAGVDNADMAACLGVNVEKVFFAVFCLGCALAGLAGVIAAPVFSIYPGMGIEILIPALIVVVIGGLSSLKGSIVGSFLVGAIQTFGPVFAPQLASVAVYLLLAAVLVLRPQGLFPARG